MENKLHKLVFEFLKHKNIQQEPSEEFIKYLLSFTKTKDHSPVSQFLNSKSIKQKSSFAYTLFTELKDINDTENKLLGFILKTSELRKYKRPKIANDNQKNKKTKIFGCLKKISLGLKDECFNEQSLFKVKKEIEKHVYEVLYQIHQYGCVYNRLKNIKNIQSMAFISFSDVIRNELVEYEENVLLQSDDSNPITFYVNLWKEFNKISVLNQIYDFFAEHPKQPFKILTYFKNNDVVNKIMESCIFQVQIKINDFINKGEFNDVFNEFFITKKIQTDDLWDVYNIDYGLLPTCVSLENAEKILYIGKCVFLLNRDDKFYSNHKIDIMSNFFQSDLDRILGEINKEVHVKFIIKNRIHDYILFAKDTFLHGRSDFIETLYRNLKSSNRNCDKYIHGKSISYSLENAFIDTFGEINSFAKQIDICILENEHAWDYITLFCKLDYPLNLIFTKEILMKYVSIFKFLWRIKKILNSFYQLKRKEFDPEGKVKIIVYINLLSKLYCYLFENVINIYYQTDTTKYKMIIDEIRKSLNLSLDNIINGIFQVSGNGKEEIDAFLSSLETLCISTSRINVLSVCDIETLQHLKNFVEKNSLLIKRGLLYGILAFIS